MRLDTYLVENGFFESKNKAQEAIKSELVEADGKIAQKPSLEVSSQQITIKQHDAYVSRAAYKLKELLSAYPLDISNKECLDVGSSTGGFTQVLLEYGAKSVTCIDVGREQLHKCLRVNPKVTLHEEMDFREFRSDKKYGVVTCDVSFISALMLLEKIVFLANDKVILLFKPQFEVGKEAKRDKKGVVKDFDLVATKKEKFKASVKALGLRPLFEKELEIKGKEGNIETIYCFEK